MYFFSFLFFFLLGLSLFLSFFLCSFFISSYSLRTPCRKCTFAPLHGFHGNLNQQLGSKNSVIIRIQSGGIYLCIWCMNESLKWLWHGGEAQHEACDDMTSVSYPLSVCWCHLKSSLLSCINETCRKTSHLTSAAKNTSKNTIIIKHKHTRFITPVRF